MGKKKKEKKQQKKALKTLHKAGIINANKVKSKCCEKYKKGEQKRCGKCPCFDLFQKVA
ncbi:hypothetical protein [Hanstruepera neustonica]|uniref:hypothetical protein n=1 Tax=Hanstruepera neustonica TaxID=1445657 RepID=UPI0013FDAA0F|nr:hypothetical protein [Hanstruepera neustonica]